MTVIHIESTQQFQKEILENQGLSIVDFRAERCGPCRMLGPIIEQLSEEYKDVKVAKINVDQNQELAGAFQVSSIPVVYFVKNGQVVERIVGANPATVYKEKIIQHSAPSTK